MQAALRRSAAALGRTQRSFMLLRASRVTGAVVALEPGYCHVMLTADLANIRNGHVGGIAGLGVAGVVAGGVLTLMSPFAAIALIPVPIIVGGTWLIGRQLKPIRDRTQLGLERALDHLEQHGAVPPRQLPPSRASVMGMIAEELRKALKP